MKATLSKNGNKNKGIKRADDVKIKEIKTKLSRRYKGIDFSKFDFDTYVKIPRKAKYNKTDGELNGKYKRNVMLRQYLLRFMTIE